MRGTLRRDTAARAATSAAHGILCVVLKVEAAVEPGTEIFDGR